MFGTRDLAEVDSTRRRTSHISNTASPPVTWEGWQ